MIHTLTKGHCVDDRYIVVQPLGSGRTSVVYEVLDKKTNSTVALKILDPMIVQDSVHIERFRREAKVLRQLQNAQVVQVYEVVESTELKYLVLEKFTGCDLKSWIQKEGIFQISQFHRVMDQILKTIAECHAIHVIHRDLKPQNIMIDKDYNIKVVDFGISRMTTMNDLTKTGTVLGTPEYLAPECFSSSHTDLRQDIYSLGCVMYEMLIGNPPFRGDNLQQVFRSKLKGEYIDPTVINSEIPTYIHEVINKCLELDLNRRYQNVNEILDDLEKKALKNRSLPAAEQVKCLNCATAYIPGADFCYHCGKYSVDIFQDGPCSVMITRCERKDLALKYIHRNYPFVSKDHLLSKFLRFPLLVAKGISEPSAQLIQNELAVMPLECVITKSLPTDFQLPRLYFLLAIVLMLPVFYFQESQALQLLTVSVVETILYLFYRQRTLPLIYHTAIKSRLKKDVDAFWPQSLSDISKIQDQKVQAILGHMLYAYTHFNTDQKQRLAEPLGKIFNSALLSNQIFSALKDANTLRIQNKLATICLQIKNETSVEKIDELIKIKTELNQEYKAYRNLMEAYGDFYNYLLGQLDQIRRFDGNTVPTFDAEKLELFNLVKPSRNEIEFRTVRSDAA